MQSDPFRTVDEVASVLDPKSWMLVGGLMVHAHSALAGVPNPRPTDDADIVLEVGVVNYAEAGRKLAEIGFEPTNPLDHREPSYRFVRGADQIDLMVPDRMTGIRFRQRSVLTVPGADSAIKRTQPFALPSGVVVRIPDLPSALSLKGAAYRTASANPVRHLRDGVVLFACADGATELLPPSKSMRSNINHLLQGLSRPEAWSGIAAETAAKASRAIRKHYRADWKQPVAVRPERFTPGGRRSKTTPASNRGSFAPQQREDPGNNVLG